MDDAPGLMCVHAHPDDEAIATGGVLARYASEGRRTAVVTCTGGELGEIFGEGMDPVEVQPRLAAVRRAELATSLEILGAGEPRLLGYRDSGMFGTPGNEDPASFWRADFDEAVGRLVAEIRAFRPSVVVTYDAYGGYGHPDHVQAHRVSVVAAEASAVPGLYHDVGAAWRVQKVYLSAIPRETIFEGMRALVARGLPVPFEDVEHAEELPIGNADELITTTVDVRPWRDAKSAALRAHASQIGPDSFFLNVPEDLQDAWFGTEWFIRHRSDVVTPVDEDDLFAGLP